MGIKGLTFFMSTIGREYYVPYQLTSTYVIISGGIYLGLYDQSNDDPRLGGDCRKMYDVTYRYFKRFIDCNLTPIVVMGGKPSTNSEATKLSRDDDSLLDFRRYNSNNYNYGERTKTSIIFRATAFYEALNDLNIFYCRTDFESDSEIFELAKKLRCPIISNDSDFFLYDGVTFLHADFVKVLEKTHLNYIECLKFNREKLMRDYSISSLHLPYLAIFFESDYCKENMFKEVLPNYRKPKADDKIRRALMWLRDETVDSAKEKILNSSYNRKSLEKEINFAFDMYTKSSTTVSSVIQKRFNFEGIKFNIREEDLVKKFNVPLDLMELARTCKLPLTVLDMSMEKSYKLRTTLEDIKQISVYAPSIPLIQGVYALLLRNEEEKSLLKLSIREGSRIVTVEKEAMPISNCCLTDENKKNILIEILKIDMPTYDSVLKFFDDGWVMFILALIFFKRECENRINDRIINSIILTAVNLHISKIYNNEVDDQDPNVEEITLNDHFKNLKKEDCEEIVRKSLKLDIKKSDRIRLNSIADIHMYMTYQSCLFYMKHIFRLLQSPYEIKISKFISGSFFYSLSNDMKESSNHEEFVKNWFEENDKLWKLYSSILEFLK